MRILSFFILVFGPRVVFAADGLINISCDGGDCGFDDFLRLLDSVISFALYISLVLAVIAFIYAGFLYMTAQGNPSQISTAHGIFIKVLIGFFFILGSWLIVNLIISGLIDERVDCNPLTNPEGCGGGT